MGIKQRIDLLIGFSFFVLLTGPCYSQTDKLLPGQLLKDGDELVSAFGNFRMGFFSYESLRVRYLGIWYHRPTDPSDSHWSYGSPKINQPVWVANRNTPITDKSGSLTIDSRDGNLKILHKGGNPIVVSSVQAMGNTSATLLGTGNFVLYEMNSSGSMERALWQSFDYPTDILLPGMKLGLNLQTGHEWFLRSWTSEDSPAGGEFTLNIDPNVSNQLIIQRRGEVLWTSGLFPHWRTLDLDSDFNFSYKAWQLWNEGKGLELVDIALEGSFSPNEVLRCIHVGLLCVQDQATDRPAMPDVVSMLANESLSLPEVVYNYLKFGTVRAAVSQAMTIFTLASSRNYVVRLLAYVHGRKQKENISLVI